MTVSSETNRAGPYFGNGVTTLFDYDFKIVDKTHLSVTRIEDDVPTLLTVDVDYTVTGVGNDEGGKIETVVAPTVGQSIVILRDVPFLQGTDLENQGKYYPETVEAALDLAAMRDQQLKEAVSRSIKLPVESSLDVLLPSPEPSKVIGWNASGDAMENYENPVDSAAAAIAAQEAAEAAALSAATAMHDLLDDTSPQLGGDLDTNGKKVLFDVNFYLGWSSGNPFIPLDASDAIIYDRANNALYLNIAGLTEFIWSASSFTPGANGGNTLGSAGKGWNGLHLFADSFVNFGNGDYTFTHSTGALTANKDFRITAPGSTPTSSLTMSSGLPRFLTRAAAIAASVPAPVQSIAVDHEGMTLSYVRHATCTALVTADGSKWAPNGEAYPHHWGWTPAMSTANQTLLLEALLEWGGDVAIPHGCTVETDYVVADLTRDLCFRIDGIHKASAEPTTLTQAMLRINCGNSTRYKVTIKGAGLIDCANKDLIPNVASGSAYLIYRSDFLTVKGPLTFYAAPSFDVATADSAIVPNYCRRTLIDGVTIMGFGDHGIYCTGGALGDATARSDDLTVVNCTFIGVYAGCIRIAREHLRTVISNNIARNSGRLVIAAGGDTNFTSSSLLVISDNIIDGSHATGLDIRYTHADTAVIITGNQIYDWATVDGTSPAVRLMGISNLIFSGNVIKPRLQTPETGSISCATGIYITEGVGDDGLSYRSKNCRIWNNEIQVLDRDNSNNGGIVARFVDQSSLDQLQADNTIIVPEGVPDYIATVVSVDKLRGAFGIKRNIAGVGVGFGGVSPRAPIEVGGKFMVSRVGDATRYVELDLDLTTLALLRGVSPVASARQIAFDCRTDTGAAPTGGALGIWFRINGSDKLKLDGNNMTLTSIPTYASNEAAVSGGLTVGMVYKVSTGELRIVV